ncbi:malignant fibrous histiocytoma-amplified sequence 1 homolog [Lingula anatina]|uniref:non-specific serine/threonine protein kinase n=1 Tax=Lingula anatina TaxID=7574 RepID=A0A1S3K109_LINAN|nr:malignant fibrous histiocytoma-amplified sequence 1 homolog [Lingula anatina]|eukprot:XP_013416217.1 malignant fibrous histiocytoma-amplified sequence 1 homolog [Lingula anatina]
MGLGSSLMQSFFMRCSDQEKLDILYKLDEDPSYQGPGTDQVETWTQLNITEPECRIPNSILRCAKLKVLNISNNEFVEKDLILTIFSLEALEDLDMSNCNITFIPPEIGMPQKLRKLNLSGNQLPAIPLPLCDLVALEELDLRNNNITAITPEVERLCKLTKIDISRNPLEEFPLTILNNKNLESLNLDGASITTVPLQLEQLTNLSELNLSNNTLGGFPLSLFVLETLEVLDLSNNNIAYVPPEISQLKNLKELNLSLNWLEEFPMAVCELVTLETLDLSTTNITTVPSQITELKNLKKLSLALSKLTEFPMSVCEMVTLETLDLSGINITTVPPQITQLTNLKELNLSDNHLEEFIISLCELVTLETIDLKNNRISKVPQQIEQLQKLKIIELDKNELTRLPSQVRQLSSLSKFSLSGNNLEQPPQEVAERGIEAIKRYFDDLVKTEETSSFRLQVQVIGESCAGKTSLVKTLTSGSPFLTRQADRTHVMEQIPWSPKEDVFLNINDFGGHDVYKVAHNFFITKEAVTLIVFNLQNISLNYQAAVGSWIDSVYSRAPDSAILLVGTHADCLSSEEVDKVKRELSNALSSHLGDMASSFRARFEELEKKSQDKESLKLEYKEKMLRIESLIQTPPRVDELLFVISSKNRHGVAELEEVLVRKSREKKYILPESWLQQVEHIETAKRSKQDPFLTLKFLVNMTGLKASQMQGGEDAQRIEDVLSFLHATGAVLWFRDKPLLKTFIFHRQDVFIDILKAILRHDIGSILVYDSDPFKQKFTLEIFESAKRDVLRRGIISRTMLECLWRRFNFGKQGLDAMLELLEKFEICYVVNGVDEDKYHFPWLLDEDLPEGVSSSWPAVPSRDESQITTELHFPITCPTGLYEMAAVHLHGHLGQFKATRTDWKHGFYAKLDNQSQICLKREVPGASSNGVIRLSIRGNDPIQVKKYSLRIFQDLLSLTEKECPGSPRDEFLVCPHCVHEESIPPTLFDIPVTLLSVPSDSPVPYHPCPEEEPRFMASADFYYPVTAGKMTELHYTSLEKHLVQVVDDVRGSPQEVLGRLVKADVITEKEKEKTSSLVLGEEDRLVGFLRRKNDSAFYIFCGALHDSGHVGTVQLLRLPDMAVMLSEDNFKELLQRLHSKDVITQSDIDAVMREPTKPSRVSALVKKLRDGKNSPEAGRAFGQFRDALYDETTRLKGLY